MAKIQNKTSVQVLKVKQSHSNALKPYILVEISQNQITKLALVDTGADVNAISYETWEIIGKPTLEKSSIIIDTMSGQTNVVEGCLNLDVFIGTTDVHKRFFVMKPGQKNTPFILGQPWQRQYNGVPNWKQEGINFETKEAKFFTPFFDENSSASDHARETQSVQEAAINSNKQVVEWRAKQTIQQTPQRTN